MEEEVVVVVVVVVVEWRREIGNDGGDGERRERERAFSQR